MIRELIRTDKNGTKYWNTRVVCDRCSDGSGIYTWGGTINGRPMYAGTCFKCGGPGYVWDIVKEYTAEHRAKLDAANAKRKAKADEERAAREAEWKAQAAEREAERARREAERLAEIERNRGHFVGEVGDKINVTVTFERTFTYEVPCYGASWKTDTVTGYVFKTDDGNTLVWKTTSGLRRKVYADNGHFRDDDSRGWYDYVRPEEGSRITIKATIKAHEEYNNVNQTILNRVTWVS